MTANLGVHRRKRIEKVDRHFGILLPDTGLTREISSQCLPMITFVN